MTNGTTRRGFLRTASVCALGVVAGKGVAEEMKPAGRSELGFPLVDFHVHLDNSTIEKVLELSAERGVKFGIVEHAGTKENVYPVVLSNDGELLAYVKML